MTVAETLAATGRAADWMKYCTPMWGASGVLELHVRNLGGNITLATRGKDDRITRGIILDMAARDIEAIRRALEELELAVAQAREACR